MARALVFAEAEIRLMPASNAANLNGTIFPQRHVELQAVAQQVEATHSQRLFVVVWRDILRGLRTRGGEWAMGLAASRGAAAVTLIEAYCCELVGRIEQCG